MTIPIQNLYVMLLYAWNRLEEDKIVNVSPEDATSVLNLFSRILVAGTRHLFKRGLDRGYIAHSDDIRGVKGKIDFSETVKRHLIPCAKLHCEFDELDYDVLHNQILKTTIDYLALNVNVDKKIRKDLVSLSQRLHAIKSARLTENIFSKVRLHRNNSFYGFLMSVCDLVYHTYMITEDPGSTKFRDFKRKNMHQVFEDFVRNFYKIELEGNKNFHVKGSELINWDTVDADSSDLKSLPVMKTDISIKTPDGYLIIDTKYYQHTLTEYYSPKVRSTNLYQIFSYLKNIEQKGPGYKKCSGMLLYPTVSKSLTLNYEIQGHKILVRTIDLSMHWQDVYTALLDLVGVKSPLTKQLQVGS
jgi:5-methylcytosine-specific restriction enzyme subunit McrC